MAEKFSSQHTLSTIAPSTNLEPSRFWTSVEEFNGRIQETSEDTEKTKSFTIFTRNNYNRIRQRRLTHGDIKTFSGFVLNFIDKEYVSPKKLFETVCNNYQFEFLLLYDLSKE